MAARRTVFAVPKAHEEMGAGQEDGTQREGGVGKAQGLAVRAGLPLGSHTCLSWW